MIVGRAVTALVLSIELLSLAALGAWARWQWMPAETAVRVERLPPPFVRPPDTQEPAGGDRVAGLTMFRGNATRTWYGRGPVPQQPEILWRYPSRRLCAWSEAGVAGTEEREWCGTGWTGQPVVVQHADGVEVIVGAYDRNIHFIDGRTGLARRQPFPTGDIIKGSVTLDPDGYPLLYAGSRDNHFRIIALDRPVPTEVWRLSADDAPQPMWNDDWDGNAVILEDHLFEGGENGWFYIVRLRRGYDSTGLVTVRPEVLVRAPGFDDSLLAVLGDREVSIENSPSVFGYRAYFANSGGLVQGLDLTHLRTDPARVRRVFRYWMGDDVDASIVVDEEGMLYVAAEQQRYNQRGREVGQLVKLDPRRRDPRVWGLAIPRGRWDSLGGAWSTPALFGRVLFVTTHAGRLLAVDRDRGEILWQLPLPPHAWSSPAVVDSTLIVADCEGVVRAWDVRDPTRRPPLRWTVRLPGGPCIESTPAVWNGRLYVGARDGFIYAIGDR